MAYGTKVHFDYIKGGRIHMKPCQAILAFISYFLLQLMVYFYISETYYTVIAGTIAVIVFAFMLYRKQMLHMSSRDLKGSQLLFCLGIGFGMSLFFKKYRF